MSFLNPLPLFKSFRFPAYVPSLPILIPSQHYFLPQSFVHEYYKDFATTISNLHDKTYAIHDSTKIIGYVISGIYFDYKRVY